MSVRTEGHVVRPVSLPFGDEGALDGHNLHPSIQPVGNEEAVFLVDGYAVRQMELHRAGPGRSPGFLELPCGAESMDSGVAISVGDIEIPITRAGGSGWIVKWWPRTDDGSGPV